MGMATDLTERTLNRETGGHMPVLMHFATFLKFLTLNTGDKICDLARYAEPGGFDFYRPSRDALTQFSSGGRTREQAHSDLRITSSSNSVERNIEIFAQVADWIERQRGQFTTPGRGIWRSPNDLFSVLIEPEISFRRSSQIEVIAVYPRREPRLNRDQSGAGILLLSDAYKGTGNERFGILDAAAGRVLRAPTNVSQALLNVEINIIEGELRRIL